MSLQALNIRLWQQTIKLAYSVHPWKTKMPEYGEKPAPDKNGNEILERLYGLQRPEVSNEVREWTSNNSSLTHTKKK